MIFTQFRIRFWIHSNKFLDKVFAKALFLKSFLKPLQNKKGQKNLGYPRKKQCFSL